MLPEAEIRDWLVLHRQTGGNPAWLARLMAYFGSPGCALREATPPILAELGITGTLAATIGRLGVTAQRELAADLGWLSQAGHQLVVTGTAQYPERLLEIPDPPPVLFCDGPVALLASLQVAMVGSRKMSSTGRKIAGMLASDLCRAGVTVTSGLAQGIDAACHQGALAVGGNTIAVLGSGCDVIYPSINKRLARAIRDAGGLIVSEFPLRVRARDYHFPQRNRIVTGLSLGTVVVEAALKSGSLISARLAMEQGREVFAVPGSVLNPLSAGCHKLIRDGAKLTERVEDIIEELVGIVTPEGSSSSVPLVRDKAQQRLLSCMSADPVSVDMLALASGIPAAEVLGMLVELEIDGLVEAGAGGYLLAPRYARSVIDRANALS